MGTRDAYAAREGPDSPKQQERKRVRSVAMSSATVVRFSTTASAGAVRGRERASACGTAAPGASGGAGASCSAGGRNGRSRPRCWANATQIRCDCSGTHATNPRRGWCVRACEYARTCSARMRGCLCHALRVYLGLKRLAWLRNCNFPSALRDQSLFAQTNTHTHTQHFLPLPGRVQRAKSVQAAACRRRAQSHRSLVYPLERLLL